MKTYLSIACLFLVAGANAQFSTGFEAGEGYSGSTSGVDVTGQQGWYIPVTGSAPGFVYVAAGNALSVPLNPFGGDQFLANKADTTYTSQIVSRSQHDTTFTGGKWSVTYDFCPLFNGTPPSTDNLGSFSLQPSTTANYFQTLYHWPDFNNPTVFTFDYGVAPAGGVSGGFTTFFSAGAAWQNLPTNHWYRCSTTWDFATNQVTEVSIQDLTTGGAKTTFNPTDWYLSGGANNVLAQPQATAVRFFAGGSTNGNVVCYDNLNVGPASTSETLAPVNGAVNIGKSNTGGFGDTAAVDGVSWRVCKFVVTSATSPIVRVRFDYTTTKTAPTAIDWAVTAKMVHSGTFKIQLLLSHD
ncbi:MAG: hypothetical protein JST30_00680, partial [Armatimonadetes bacterium]|nr:hypothetical protein [Armatimonadota bacterium]